MAVPTKDLLEFLSDCELRQYHGDFVSRLKVNTVPQLKYVVDEDLLGLGMSKPEIRRLRHNFKREHPKGALVKIKKILAKGPADTVSHSTVSISPPILEKSSGAADKHIISEEAVTLLKIIGTGEFGYVQQGVWTKENGEQLPVAVKCLPRDQMRSQASEFLDEATIMHSVCHPHVVQLYGVILGADNIMMVTEYAPLRSLLECLKDQNLRSLFSIRHLCDLSNQLAEGMTYLEKNRLIHRDLAARNVLVFAEDKVKISDFGLSRALGVGSDYYQSRLNTGLKLPIAWCAPECINFLKFTSASDVWSFGVLLWEMFTYGEQPWAGFNGLEIMQAIDAPNFHRLPQPTRCPDDFYSLMTECWRNEPTERPKFADVLNSVQQLKPPQVIMMKDTPVEVCSGEEYLKFKVKNVVTVLAKSPSDPPKLGLWRGILELTGDVGYFDPTCSSPYFEVVPSTQLLRKIKLNRTESARMSIRNAYKATPNLISRPQNDLRHLGHVGYDGVCFGDVSFIGNNKLPTGGSRTAATRRSEDDLRTSLPMNGTRLDGGSKFTGYSLSSSTLTGGYPAPNEDDELADFKLPGFSSDTDNGSSLMDEVLRTLSATTSEHDNEMKDLLAGFENLGLSVDTRQSRNVHDRLDRHHHRQQEEDEADEGSRNGGDHQSILRNSVAAAPPQPPTTARSTLPLQQRPDSFVSGSSRVTISGSSVFSNTNGAPAGPPSHAPPQAPPVMKKPTHPPPSVAPVGGSSRAPSEVSSLGGGRNADSKSNGDKNADNYDNREEEEEEEEENDEEEAEDGSLFESSSYSSGKEVSDHYNGIDDDKTRARQQQQQQSPLHAIGRPTKFGPASPTSSKSGSLRRSSEDESKKSPSVSSAQISSPRLLESSNASLRLIPKRSVETSDDGDARSPTSTQPLPINPSGPLALRLNPSAARGNLNQKLRAPIIPGRQAPMATADDEDPSTVDPNPLRRLRQSAGSGGPRPMMTFRPAGQGDPQQQTTNAARNLNANASFFDKLKEQQRNL